MHKYRAPIIILFSLSCTSDKATKDNKSESSAAEKQNITKSPAGRPGNTTSNPNKVLASGIIGIWATESDASATFAISKDTINYVDQLFNFKYNLLKDSVVIHYDGYNDTFKIDLKGQDTLILSNKRDRKIAFRRFKD